jgi:hypothetical protein
VSSTVILQLQIFFTPRVDSDTLQSLFLGAFYCSSIPLPVGISENNMLFSVGYLLKRVSFTGNAENGCKPSMDKAFSWHLSCSNSMRAMF